MFRTSLGSSFCLGLVKRDLRTFVSFHLQSNLVELHRQPSALLGDGIGVTVHDWAAESFLETQSFIKYICYEYSTLPGTGSTKMDHPDSSLRALTDK